MNTRSLISAITILLLTACAVNKVPVATGGSKADGTVELSYQVGLFEQPVVDLTAADDTAIKRCKAWGYNAAEAFGGQQNICQAYNGYGDCVNMLVKLPYQCTGGK